MRPRRNIRTDNTGRELQLPAPLAPPIARPKSNEEAAAKLTEHVQKAVNMSGTKKTPEELKQQIANAWAKKQAETANQPKGYSKIDATSVADWLKDVLAINAGLSMQQITEELVKQDPGLAKILGSTKFNIDKKESPELVTPANFSYKLPEYHSYLPIVLNLQKMEHGKTYHIKLPDNRGLQVVNGFGDGSKNIKLIYHGKVNTAEQRILTPDVVVEHISDGGDTQAVFFTKTYNNELAFMAQPDSTPIPFNPY